jgi:hypothetical protein
MQHTAVPPAAVRGQDAFLVHNRYRGIRVAAAEFKGDIEAHYPGSDDYKIMFFHFFTTQAFYDFWASDADFFRLLPPGPLLPASPG